MDQNDNSTLLDKSDRQEIHQRYAALIQRDPDLPRLIQNSFHRAPAPAFPGASEAPEQVRAAQAMLEALGYPTGGRNHRHRWDGASAMDGICGPGTDAAIRKFQEEHGLEASGQLDATTLSSMRTANKTRLAELGFELQYARSPAPELKPVVWMRAKDLQDGGVAAHDEDLHQALRNGGFTRSNSALEIEPRRVDVSSQHGLPANFPKTGHGLA